MLIEHGMQHFLYHMVLIMFLFATSKQWIKASLVNFICETKSVSKQDLVTCPNNFVQWNEAWFSSWLHFLIFIESYRYICGYEGNIHSINVTIAQKISEMVFRHRDLLYCLLGIGCG